MQHSAKHSSEVTIRKTQFSYFKYPLLSVSDRMLLSQQASTRLELWLP